METFIDIVQGTINLGALGVVLTILAGRIFPREKIARVFYSLGAKVSKFGSKSMAVATWNAIELIVIDAFDTITQNFAIGLRSDNEE